MKEKDVIIGKCIDLSYDGLGVVKADDSIVFVNGLLPIETAKIGIYKVSKSFSYGRVLELIDSSKDRVKPICNKFGYCGGCELMHMSYSSQLEYKIKKAKDNIKRIGNLDLSINGIIGMDDPYYYRNKIQIPFGMKNGKVICGFYRKNSHSIVDLEECYIEKTIATDIARFMKNLCNEYKISSYDENTKKGSIRHLLIRNNNKEEYMVVIIIKDEINRHTLDEVVNKLVNRYKNIKSIILNYNPKINNIILGDKSKLLYGKEVLIEDLLGLKFEVSYNSFFQTNHVQTEKLYQKVLEYVNPNKNTRIIDAYCGVGTISLLLAKKAKIVYGIEIVEEAIKNANKNRELNNIENATFVVGSSEEMIYELNDNNIDVIVVDPPRKGLDKKLVDAIIESSIKKIVYVSCDSSTLARDLGLLNDKYIVKDICVVDMFPHTVNIECVVCLERK